MNYAWQRTADATDEPVDLYDAKVHLYVGEDDTTQDSKIERDLRAARHQVEDYLRAGLVTQTWVYAQDRFTDEILLPMAAPLASVTSVQYYDTSGVLQTLSASVYTVDTRSEPGRIVLAPDQQWPQVQAGRTLAVVVTYVVGRAVANVDPRAQDAILLLVADRYEHREQTVVGSITSAVPTGVEALLAPMRCLGWRPPAC